MKTNTNALSRRSFIAGAAAVGAIACANPALAFADDAASKQAEAATALASLKNMQTSLDEASNNYAQALSEQEQAQANMDAAQTQIDEQSAKIEGYQAQLGTRARACTVRAATFLDVLLGSATFEEFSSNWDILNNLNDQDAQLVAETKDAREQIEASKQEYAAQEKVAEQKTNEAAEIKQQAESTVAQMQALYDSLSAEAAALLEQERAAQEAAAAAQAAAVVAASAAGTTDNNSSGNTGGGSSSGGSSSGSTSTPFEGGSDAVSRARACLGAPYGWGDVGPYAYDCSGLVSYCLTGSHSRLGTTYTFMGWPTASNPSPGDVATNSTHCGIYIGGGQMIHAADYGIGVITGPVQSGMKIVRWA